jgi:hypothetical protein
MLFIPLFVALCVKLDPGTHKGSFCLKTGCDKLLCHAVTGRILVLECMLSDVRGCLRLHLILHGIK